jgi:hypothetical protein
MTPFAGREKRSALSGKMLNMATAITATVTPRNTQALHQFNVPAGVKKGKRKTRH